MSSHHPPDPPRIRIGSTLQPNEGVRRHFAQSICRATPTVGLAVPSVCATSMVIHRNQRPKRFLRSGTDPPNRPAAQRRHSCPSDSKLVRARSATANHVQSASVTQRPIRSAQPPEAGAWRTRVRTDLRRSTAPLRDGLDGGIDDLPRPPRQRSHSILWNWWPMTRACCSSV